MHRKVYCLPLLYFCVVLLGFSCQREKPLIVTQDKTVSEKLTALYERAEKYGNANPDSLAGIAREILVIANDANDHTAIVKGQRYAAKSYWNSGNHAMAMKTSVKALRDAEKWEVNSEIPNLYAIIGNLHKEKNNYSMAFEAVDKGMNASRKISDTVSIIYMARLKAMFTQGMGANKKDTALIHKSLNMHLEGLKMAELSPTFERARIPYYNNIAQVYVKRNQLDSAEYYVNKAVVLSKKYDQRRSLTYSYTWLALVFEKRGKQEQSLKYLAMALQIAKDLKNPFRQMEIYDYTMEVLRGAERYKDALEAYTSYSLLRDSLKVLENVRQIGELQVRYEAEKKDRQIGILGELNELRSKQTIGALAGLGLVLGLSVMMFGQYRVIRRNNAVLAENNIRIKAQSDKMQFLMKELHHRVKNNLQIVSNLLSLQANRLADDDARKIMKAGQQRIETMSIIHRSLYSQESVNMVNMKDYVADLLDSIVQSFGDENDPTFLNVTVEVGELDVDIAMPLGLIINEWITNSFKHAFHNVLKPVITLNLVETTDQIKLEISDNGPGFDLVKWEKPNGSFGVRLIKVLSRQLEGFCRVVEGSGACLQLEIPLNRSEL